MPRKIRADTKNEALRETRKQRQILQMGLQNLVGFVQTLFL